jgi:hypothetical protein
MSMPSSSDEVATTAGSRPDFSSSSTSARCSRDTEPWWARATTGGAPSPVPAWAETAAGIPPGCRGPGAHPPGRPPASDRVPASGPVSAPGWARASGQTPLPGWARASGQTPVSAPGGAAPGPESDPSSASYAVRS